MKGSTKVVKGLNKLLTKELTSVDIYFLHSRVYEDWGLTKLYTHIDGEKNHEGLHADMVLKRILFLEGQPDVASREAFKIDLSVKAMLEQSLKYETENQVQLKDLIALCETEKDFETRNMLLILLKDTEEDHIKWIEIQLGLITKVGEQNYYQSQM
jgi:bacterioferritin